MMRKATKHTQKHKTLYFNACNNKLELIFDINKPHCFNADAAIMFQTNEPEFVQITGNIIKRYKRYIKDEIKTLKSIVILEAPSYLHQLDRFSITFSMTALLDETLTIHKLETIGERIIGILEAMTRELNENWVVPVKCTKGYIKHGKYSMLKNKINVQTSAVN